MSEIEVTADKATDLDRTLTIAFIAIGANCFLEASERERDVIAKFEGKSDFMEAACTHYGVIAEIGEEIDFHPGSWWLEVVEVYGFAVMVDESQTLPERLTTLRSVMSDAGYSEEDLALVSARIKAFEQQ